MALLTSFGVASAHTISSAKYYLKIYTENIFELIHSRHKTSKKMK